MSADRAATSAELKEGYWVRIGDDSYAIHRILGVSTTELPPVESTGGVICAYVGIGIGIFSGAQTGSWVVGLVLSIVLFVGAVIYFVARSEKDKKRRGIPCNVSIELDKKGPRVVAAGIPKLDAERLQMEIEAIVAAASKAEAENTNTEQGGGGQPATRRKST